jgi:xanthine dehydrogenase small subunit
LNKIFNEENINEAKKIIKKEFDPIDDMRASKNYRTKISQNLLERFLNENNKIKSTLY